MRITKTTTSLGAAALVLAIAAPGLAGPGFDNKYDSTTLVDECEDSNGEVIGTVTYNGPEYLWPPNHKMQAISVTAADVDATEDDNDTVALAVEIASDEAADAPGSGNTPVDSNVAGGEASEDETTVDGEVRSERAGTEDGRTYTLNYQADFTNGEQDPETYTTSGCAGSFTVHVPHDMRGGAGWKHDEDGDGDGDRGNGKNDPEDPEGA